MRLLRLYSQGVSYIAFLDCDNLSDVDWLSDFVANDTRTLIVGFAKDMLMRPWCAGVIVTAMVLLVTTIKVVFREFA